ncbi:MAG: thioredoxin family protein [Planctomycetaceae bacterium]|jgi:thiol:disulfide interchange protein|nr:thioredoxin family protein [Planctomycetaceae bacterium]
MLKKIILRIVIFTFVYFLLQVIHVFQAGIFRDNIFQDNIIYAQFESIDQYYKELDSGLFDSKIKPVPVRGGLTLSASYSGKYFVVKASIPDGYHTFSVTQPAGGSMRSTFNFDSKEIAESLIDIRPAAPPKLKYEEVFNLNEQHHEKSVTWIFRFNKSLPPDAEIKLTYNGQICRESCMPITKPFVAKFDSSLNVEKILSESAAELDEQFIFRVSEKSNFSLPENYIPQESVQVSGMAMLLVYAFLGGVILNFMPCVLPVIGLKILSFFEQAGKSRLRAFLINFSYSLGLLSVFIVLAILNYGLSKLFTFELFSIVMAVIVFAMALSLMGLWEIAVPSFVGGETSVKLMTREGFGGAFCKGIITTLLAVPCGAPLLSTAITWTDEQIRIGNTPMVFLIYVVIGLGMASPYLLIGAFPELLRFLPKPGQWMDTFRKTMGFCLLIAVVWILYFVRVEQLLSTITLLFAVWFACWLIGRQEYVTNFRKRITARIVSIAVITVTVFFSYDFTILDNPYTLQSAMRARLSGGKEKPFTLENYENAISSGSYVIVDFTADWCVTCKVLEATVLNSEKVKKTIAEKNVTFLVADCTRENEATEFLHKLGPGQVPVLAFFDPKNLSKPVVLRGFYSQKNVLDILENIN